MSARISPNRGRPPFRPGGPSRLGGPRSARESYFGREKAQDSPQRTPREAALDRIQALRVGLNRKATWLKRGQVFGVAGTLGFGLLQGWWWLSALAIPVALGFWWTDGSVTRADDRLSRLYDAVFAGQTEPPGMGEEGTLAERLPDPPGAVRKAMLSGPGAGLHLMMFGIALACNLFL